MFLNKLLLLTDLLDELPNSTTCLVWTIRLYLNVEDKWASSIKTISNFDKSNSLLKISISAKKTFLYGNKVSTILL